MDVRGAIDRAGILMRALWCVSAVALILAGCFGGELIAATIPKVVLIYQPGGTVFDRNCTAITKTTIPSGWIDEADRRLPEFQAMWDKDGAAYLRVVFDEIGVPFPYQEVQVTLTVCDVGASMSSPLIIDVRNWMPQPLDGKGLRLPAPWRFPFIVFHELMHHYTRQVYETSALVKKHQSESVVVKKHLHVLALEKLALVKLARPQDLASLDRGYRSMPPADPYRRAWEIVNDEGYEAFVSELKLSTAR